MAGEEVIAQYAHVLDRFDGGLPLLLLRQLRPDLAHDVARDGPAASRPTSRADGRYADVIPKIYEQLRRAWSGARSIAWATETLLVVMSDHGFTSWRRSFHLNTLAARATAT